MDTGSTTICQKYSKVKHLLLGFLVGGSTSAGKMVDLFTFNSSLHFATWSDCPPHYSKTHHSKCQQIQHFVFTPLLPPCHISPFTKCKLCVRPSPQLMPSLKVIYTRAVIYIWQLAVNYTTVMCLIITGRSLPLQEVGPRINHRRS